jgi:hypothetical protein
VPKVFGFKLEQNEPEEELAREESILTNKVENTESEVRPEKEGRKKNKKKR